MFPKIKLVAKGEERWLQAEWCQENVMLFAATKKFVREEGILRNSLILLLELCT